MHTYTHICVYTDIGKDPDAEKDWGQEEKRETEDEIGWMASPTQWTGV